jgi:hypothetical protein
MLALIAAPGTIRATTYAKAGGMPGKHSGGQQLTDKRAQKPGATAPIVAQTRQLAEYLAEWLGSPQPVVRVRPGEGGRNPIGARTGGRRCISFLVQTAIALLPSSRGPLAHGLVPWGRPGSMVPQASEFTCCFVDPARSEATVLRSHRSRPAPG